MSLPADFFSRFIEKWDLYSIELANYSAPELNVIFSYEKIEAVGDPNDWRLIIRDRGENYFKTIDNRLKLSNEYTGFAIRKRDTREIIFLTWIRYKTFYDDKIKTTIKLTGSGAFFYDSYCIPAYRGNHFQYKMFIVRINYSYANGLKNGYTVVSYFNQASLKAINRLGFKKIATRVFFKPGLIKRILNKIKKADV